MIRNVGNDNQVFVSGTFCHANKSGDSLARWPLSYSRACPPLPLAVSASGASQSSQDQSLGWEVASRGGLEDGDHVDDLVENT